MTVSMALALLILRVVVGMTLIFHGTQKLFGWFGGSGLTQVMQGFAKQGFKPVWLWVSLVILGEVGGGLSVATGFLTPLGAAGIFGAMFMATFKSHWKKGFFASRGGYEYALVLMTVSLALGLIGPGNYSLDSLFGILATSPILFIVLAVAAVLVDLIGIYITRTVRIAPSNSASPTAS
jgi:putative oxidoreductase